MSYTVSQTAEFVGKAPSTIRGWGANVKDFLSPSANPGPDTERRYTDDDIAILKTVAVLRGQRVKFPDIRERLASGELLEELPTEEEPTPEPAPAPPADAPQSRQLVPYSLVQDFVQMFKEAEARAAAEKARADMLQSQLEELQREEKRGFWRRLFGG